MRLGINCRFLSTPKMTGVERVAFELTRRIVERRDLKCTIFCGEQTMLPPNPRVQAWKDEIGSTSIQRHAWEQLVLPSRLKAAKVDVLFNPTLTGPVFESRPQIIMIHDVSFLPSFGWHRRLFSYYYSIVIPFLVRRGTTIITGSDFSRNEIISRLGAHPERVHVVPYGVSEAFSPVDASNVKRKYGLPERYILFVGSIEPRKNLKTLLRAMDLVRKSGDCDDLVLVLVGAAGKNFSSPEIDDLVSHLGNGVRLLGYTDEAELPSLYSGALALAFPSLYEGFGLPALEAMACGTPTIASNTTSLPEVVGDTGILVDPLNVEELASAIKTMATRKDSENLSIRCQQRAAEFSWDTTVNRILEISMELKK